MMIIGGKKRGVEAKECRWMETHWRTLFFYGDLRWNWVDWEEKVWKVIWFSSFWFLLSFSLSFCLSASEWEILFSQQGQLQSVGDLSITEIPPLRVPIGPKGVWFERVFLTIIDLITAHLLASCQTQPLVGMILTRMSWLGDSGEGLLSLPVTNVGDFCFFDTIKIIVVLYDSMIHWSFFIVMRYFHEKLEYENQLVLMYLFQY